MAVFDSGSDVVVVVPWLVFPPVWVRLHRHVYANEPNLDCSLTNKHACVCVYICCSRLADTVTDTGRNDGTEHRDAAVAASAARHARLRESLLGLDTWSSETRSSRKEAILRRVFQALTQSATGTGGVETVRHASSTLVRACRSALRGGAPAERYAACRVLEAASVLLGEDQDEWHESIERDLRRVVHGATKATAVRMAALRACSMSAFINTSDTETSEALMDVCQAIANETYRNETVPVALRATALDCWALLATTVADYYLAGQDDVQLGRGLDLLSLLKACLETTSMELRSAAGECLSLIHEARLNLGVDEETAENSTARRYRRGSWDGSEFEVLMDEVKQLVATLSMESGHHMSKKAKKEQRATFREFVATIVDDEAPEEIINFRGGSLSLHTWREIIQLNFIRHCLQGGFQIQLLTNATLQSIFGANGAALNDFAGLSQLEKRLTLSKTSEASKIADQVMAKQRTKRQNAKNHFLTSDGDDL